MNPPPGDVSLILKLALEPCSKAMVPMAPPTLDLTHWLFMILVSLCCSHQVSYIKRVPCYIPMPWIMPAHGIFSVNMHSLQKTSLWETAMKG